jgi:hypothetical protein
MIEDSIAKELDMYFAVTHLQPGDITIDDCVARWGGGHNTWRARFKAGKVPAGYTTVKVKNENSNTVWVLRKA